MFNNTILRKYNKFFRKRTSSRKKLFYKTMKISKYSAEYTEYFEIFKPF